MVGAMLFTWGKAQQEDDDGDGWGGGGVHSFHAQP